MTRTAWRTVPLALVAAVGAGVLPAPGAARAEPGAGGPVAALERAAHPLATTEAAGSTKDLRPLDRMVGGADVVGLGEATHGSHEFFTLKDRVFRHLVREKGFTTFAQEVSWTTGLRFDAYVRGGKGNARTLVHRELAKTPWDTEEYVELLTWMRAYNEKHPERQLRFMGDDLNYPEQGRELFDAVGKYVRAHEPDLAPRIDKLYAPLRRLTDGDTYMGRPLAERKALAKRARTAFELLKERQPRGRSRAFAWTLQHARSVVQTADMYAFPLDTDRGKVEAMLYRDRTMAENTAWWQRQTGGRILLSAHNGHVGYVSSDVRYPKLQGAFLRDLLGKRYLTVGTTFDRGGLMAQSESSTKWRPRYVDPATPSMNEHTLDKVRHDDFLLDLRTAPAAARKWLDKTRPTRAIGNVYPERLYDTDLARTYDVLIHLHKVTPAHRQPR